MFPVVLGKTSGVEKSMINQSLHTNRQWRAPSSRKAWEELCLFPSECLHQEVLLVNEHIPITENCMYCCWRSFKSPHTINEITLYNRSVEGMNDDQHDAHKSHAHE